MYSAKPGFPRPFLQKQIPSSRYFITLSPVVKHWGVSMRIIHFALYALCIQVSFFSFSVCATESDGSDSRYIIEQRAEKFDWQAEWDSQSWTSISTLNINRFHPLSSDHRPRVQAKLTYDETHIFGMFRVEDCYVLSKRTEYQEPVARDSCVEIFVKPKADKGYFNFEFNAGGNLLLFYIEDHKKLPSKDRKPGVPPFKKFEMVSPEWGKQVRIQHSLSEVVWPEIQEPTTWTLSFAIPIALFEAYCGSIGDPKGQEWRANFYKCADDSSHPHWAAWAPVGDNLSFHNPEIFGTLVLK